MNIELDKIPSPCYVLEESLLERNLQILKKIEKEAGISIICALKGFAFHSVFPKVAKYLKGATASSLHEAKLVYNEMGLKPHTYCPVYVPEDFEKILKLSSHLTFNSLSEWERWKGHIKLSKQKVSCGLRVNPGYSEIETAMYNPASPESRLGIARKLLGNILPKGIEGLHFHALCENDSHTLERVLEHFSKSYDGLIRQAKWINMGGGHLITSELYDVEHAVEVLKKFKTKYPHLKEIILEPGSAVGWETGYLVSTVLDIVGNGGQQTAMLDISITCHMPDCLEMPYKPFVWGETKEGKYEYNLGGMSCLAGDFLKGYRFDKPLEIGQKLVFNDMIHYTMVKTTTFNGINLPSIGIWTKKDKFKLVKKFGYKSYKKRLS